MILGVQKKPSSVKLNGKDLSYQYDDSAGTMTVAGLNLKMDAKLDLQWVD